MNDVIRAIVKAWPGKCTIINGRPRHPQSQGLIEQANGTVESMIRARRLEVGENFDWPSFIPFVQCSLNCTYQHAIKMTPYEACFGKKPNWSSIFSLDDEEDNNDVILIIIY